MTTDDLTKRIARALDKNFNPDRYPIMAAMFIDYAAAVLPIVEAEVRKAKAEAWDEGQHDLYLYYQSEGLAGSEGRNPYRDTEYETGDQT